jgi:hypothetical protein
MVRYINTLSIAMLTSREYEFYENDPISDVGVYFMAAFRAGNHFSDQ